MALSLSRIVLALSYVSKTQSIFRKDGRPYKGLLISCFVSMGLLCFLVFVPYVNIISSSDNIYKFQAKKDYLIFIVIALVPFISIIVNELKKLIIRQQMKVQAKFKL